jgi:hypothetical protein
MKEILFEIIQEEFQVFKDRLTNCGLMELDEIVSDVVHSMTR